MRWQSTAFFAVHGFIIGSLVIFIRLIDCLIKRGYTFRVFTRSIKLQSYLTDWRFTFRASKQKGFVFTKGKLFPFFLDCVLLRIFYQLDSVYWAFLRIDAEVLSNLEITSLLPKLTFFFCYIDRPLFQDLSILKDSFSAIFFSRENFHIDSCAYGRHVSVIVFITSTIFFICFLTT